MPIKVKQVIAAFFSLLIASTPITICVSQAQAISSEEAWLAPLTPLPRLGQVVRSYQAPGRHKGLVVFIEDLHFNRSVQRNIEQLIEFYSRSYPTAPVGVEGAAGSLDYSSLSKHYSPKSTKELTSFLIENGEITGSEAYAMQENQPKRLTGIENERYYQYHLQLFRQSYSNRMELRDSVLELLSQLNELQDLLGHSDHALLELARQATLELNNLEALLSERVTLEEAKAISKQLPQTLALIRSLQPALTHPISLDADDVQNAVQASVDFYAAALLRDEPIAENTLHLLDAQGLGLGNQRLPSPKPKIQSAAALLVAGGFHADGVTQALERAGVSYVVIMPTVAEQTPKDDALYIRRLMGEHIDMQSIYKAVIGKTMLGTVGDILSSSGVAVVDSWSRLREGRKKMSWLQRMVPHLSISSGPILEEESGRPLWSPDILRSEQALYDYTVASIQYRIQKYARVHHVTLLQTADLAADVTQTGASGTVRKGTVASQASSDILEAGLDPAKDLAVAPIDITFKADDVTPAEKKKVIRLLLEGKILHQFIMAGEASRMKKSIREKGLPVLDEELEAMYFLDLNFLHNAVYESNASKRTSMWGPRQILQIHYLIAELAKEYGPEFGISVHEALENQFFEIHTNSKADDRIAHDFKTNYFYGFAPEHVVFTPQHVDRPFELVDGKVRPSGNSEPVALGNGWPLLESAMPFVSYQILQGRKVVMDTDALMFFRRLGIRIAHQYRVNDLYNLSTDALDIPSLAREVQAIQSGRSNYVVRMVANPKGTKGGIPLRVTNPNLSRPSLLLADTLAASDIGTQAFLADLKTSVPYHRFANTFSILMMRDVLLHHGLVPDFELKKFPMQRSQGVYLQDVQLINPQYVSGMLTIIPELKAITIHEEGRLIQDLKDLSDVTNAADYLNRQDAQPGFNDLAAFYLRHYLAEPKIKATKTEGRKAAYRPRHVLLSFGIFAAPLILLAAHGQSVFSWHFMSLLSLLSFAVGLSKELYVIRRLKNENLPGAELLRALVRDQPVEEFNQTSGEVRGLTGLIPLAHTARSHALFQNEFGAHGMDLITIPLQAIHSAVTWFLARFFPRMLLNRGDLLRLPLVHALQSKGLASFMPSGTMVDAQGNIFLPVRQSSFAKRLQQVFFFNPQEQAFVARAREQIASAA